MLTFLYVYFGENEKCECLIDRICDELFSEEVDGFPGDEDTGSMAAWYVLACLGMYCICPADNEYAKIKPRVKGKINGIDIEAFVIDKVRSCKN